MALFGWLSGNNEHAMARVVRFGQGRQPLMSHEQMTEAVPTLREKMDKAGRDFGELTIMGMIKCLPEMSRDDVLRSAETWRKAGATGLNVHFNQLKGFSEVGPFLERLDRFAENALGELRTL